MLLLIVLLGWIGAVITGGIWYAKRQDQKVRDHNRKTYRLHFPADLSPEQVTVWLRSISGTLRGGKFNLTGKPTLAFETFATSEGITHRLKVPFGAEPFVIPQLRLAGINAVQEEEFEDRNWLKGVEVGITQSGRQLRIYDPADISTSLLATMQSFSPDEALIVQLVITPATPTEQPIHDRAASLDYLNAAKGYKATRDEVNDRRAKLEEPNFMAVLRVAGAAKSDASAQHLVERIRMALTAVRGPKIRFEKRMVTIGKLRDRIRLASGSVIFPMQLSAPELSALIAWPMGRPIIAGLAPSMARHFPPSAMIPQTGRVIGRATQPGAERPVAVSYANALRHTYSIGGTGSGKSVTLANLMAQDMEHGHGVILIDAKSDQDALFHRALRVIPSHRLDDVIILDVEDTEMPVGFNILDQGTNELSISQISRLIADMYANASQSIQAPRIFHHCLTALAEAGGHTLIDMPAVLSNFPEGSAEREWQDALGRSVKNRETQLFLQQFMNMSRSARDDMARPVFNRIWEFTDPPAIRRILGQRTSSFSMADVIAQNKILLVYINAAKIGQASSSLLGTLLVNSIWDSVQIGRSARPNFLYLDEFADFIDLPVGVEAMLTKARGSNLGLVMAHQHMAQLRTEVRAAVLNNSATKIFFKAGADDARVLAKEVPGGFVSHEDLQLLARYNTLCTIATDSGTSPPVTVQMYPEPRNTGNENRARQLSRQRYGRPRHEVEQSYSARPIPVDVRPSQRRAPRVSGEGWL